MVLIQLTKKKENFGIAEIHFQKKNAGFVGKAQFFMMEAVVGQARDEDRPTTGLSLEFDDNVPPDGRRKRTGPSKGLEFLGLPALYLWRRRLRTCL